MPILSDSQKQKFYRNGYLKISKVVPQRAINMTLRSINHSIGNGIDPKRIAQFRADSFCPELVGKPVITDLLFETPLWEMAQELTNQGDLALQGGGQVALRFPVMTFPGGLHPHLDGMYQEGNRVKIGKIWSFTMLCGIFLSDIPNKFWGNFTVWPGTHRLFAEYFREHGHEVLYQGLPKVDMPDSEQLTGNVGDVILCHYQLAHTVVSNVSPFVRYAVFFRLSHVKHSLHKNKIFSDIWMEWDGMRKIVRAQE